MQLSGMSFEAPLREAPQDEEIPKMPS